MEEEQNSQTSPQPEVETEATGKTENTENQSHC